MPKLNPSLLLVSLLALGACRDGGLNSANAVLRVDQSTLDFGSAYSGHQAIEKTLVVHNSGRGVAQPRYTTPQEPFELLTAPESMNPGDTVLRLRFKPLEVQAFTDQLVLETDTQKLVLVLTGNGQAIPECGQPSACHTLQFDANLNTCVEAVEADGTACDPHDVCVQNATCTSGRCTGAPIACDDGNACTTDSCNALFGCVHTPAPPCPGDGACMVGTCDPQLGCGMVPADDGTACGPIQTCTTAQVCVSGQCTLRDPPDGYVCAPATPCQEQGVCMGTNCVQPPKVALTETWRFDTLDTQTPEAADAGVTPVVLHDFVLDEGSGDVSLMGFFQTPLLNANTPTAFDAPNGGARRCMVWNDRLVCADYPGGVNGQVTVLDRTTGTTLWSFALGLARPDFRALTDNLFMGRMAVLGSDRLAALFEGYVANNSTSTADCRLYFLTILDASGGLISSEHLTDPELSTCDHPHPYGFSADVDGNLYVGFAPTTTGGGPPLHPDQRTTLMSFTRDGTFRWKFTDFSLVGGELAVADGLAFPENASQAVVTSTGQGFYKVARPFGRAAATDQRVVASPVDGDVRLDAYVFGQGGLAWTQWLPSGELFWGDQLRLATWTSSRGPKTVAVAFTQSAAGSFLRGWQVDDGAEAFSCPLSLASRSAPQLAEVGDGTLALMEGGGCEKCDPPFATSSAAFHTFDVPRLSPATAPWVGTFGGAGHDGQEDARVFVLPAHGLPAN